VGFMSKKNAVNLAIFIVAIIIIVLVVILGNNISKNKEANNNEIQEVNVDDVDNVSIVDEKLKAGDYRVTQPYLFNYLTRKSAIWYSSNGKVDSIKKKGSSYYISVSGLNDKKKKVTLVSESNVKDIKKKDKVYFVGNINVEGEYIQLTKISKEVIDYNSVFEISLEDLSDNIYYIKNTYVLVSGYMVTDETEYKLYANKASSKKDETLVNYFTINWAEEFKYTGNKDVVVKCFIGDRYNLIGCELEK